MVSIKRHELWAYGEEGWSTERIHVEQGQTVLFTGKVELTEPSPSDAYFTVDLYIDGELVKPLIASGWIGEGQKSSSYTFTWRFDKPGTYRVKTDISIPSLGIYSVRARAGRERWI